MLFKPRSPLMYFSLYLISVLFKFEDAAKEIADEITKPRPEGEEDVQDIQIMLTSKENPCNLRALKVFLLLYFFFCIGIKFC